MRCTTWVLAIALAVTGCDDEGGADGDDAGPPAPGTDAGDAPGTDAGDDPPSSCDWRAVDGRIVIEAENLPLTEDWQVGDENAGFSGDGYIEWTGDSHNNDPTHGVMEVDLQFDSPGTYQLQWHTRIGRGDNPTEHNDVWVQFPDVAAFYGIAGPDDMQDRVYPKPQCEDDGFMDPIRAMANVAEATCPNGSTRDGWFKVYSSGATDWRWSARTSDRDAHDVVIEIDAPGVYTLMLAARADFSQLDRIVIHEVSQPNDEVRDLSLAETACP